MFVYIYISITLNTSWNDAFIYIYIISITREYQLECRVSLYAETQEFDFVRTSSTTLLQL